MNVFSGLLGLSAEKISALINGASQRGGETLGHAIDGVGHGTEGTTTSDFLQLDLLYFGKPGLPGTD
jgi:hypothetical protein